MMKRIMRLLASWVFPKPAVRFTDALPPGEPVVFVANHEKNYGPGVMQLYFPVRCRPWVIFHMLERGACSAYVQKSYFEERLGWPAWAAAFAARAAEPMLIWLMQCADPIPVYRGDPRRIRETFRASLEALGRGENLLIFPESPVAGAYSPDVKEFFDGFVYLAKLYQRQSGKSLLFCPVSINPQRQTLTAGQPIRFNPQEEYAVESERVRQHLMRQVAGLYHAGTPAAAPARRAPRPQDARADAPLQWMAK